MAPKKKGPFFLMRELQNERKERNRPCSLDDVREEAGEKWRLLTEEEKAVYEAIANEEREEGSLHNKFSSDGRTIASVLHEADEKIQMRRTMVEGIQRYVDDIGTVEGENTHGIPITGFQEGTRDYRAVVNNFVTYLLLSADDAVLPPLFCKEEHIPQAEGCLRWLERGARTGLDFPVWDTPPLLGNVVGEELLHAEAENILDSALFDYELKSLCDYHHEIDKNCALGECRRLGYKMSNALLHAFRIEHPIDYQHLPPRFHPSLNFEVFQMNLLLTEEEKAAYEAMANEECEKGSLHNKFTSDGRSIASVLQEADEKIQMRRAMVERIQRYVDDIGTVEGTLKLFSVQVQGPRSPMWPSTTTVTVLLDDVVALSCRNHIAAQCFLCQLHTK